MSFVRWILRLRCCCQRENYVFRVMAQWQPQVLVLFPLATRKVTICGQGALALNSQELKALNSEGYDEFCCTVTVAPPSHAASTGVSRRLATSTHGLDRPHEAADCPPLQPSTVVRQSAAATASARLMRLRSSSAPHKPNSETEEGERRDDKDCRFDCLEQGIPVGWLVGL